MPGGKILCGETDDVGFIKLVGDIRYTMSQQLNAIVEQWLEASRSIRMVFDLTETEQIDSTGLGLLAKAARKALETGAPRPAIVSVRRDIDLVLSSMGFGDFFELTRVRPSRLPDLRQVAEGGTVGEDTPAVMLDAHKCLASLSEKNRETFSKVVELLEKDIDKRQSGN